MDMNGVSAAVTALTALLVATVIPAIKWAWTAQREAGKADAYKDESQRTIAQKDRELDEKATLLAEYRRRLEECEAWRNRQHGDTR